MNAATPTGGAGALCNWRFKANLVKVCDFGLTVPFDEGSAGFKMRKAAKLSIKWTDAIAVTNKMFGEHSDVWSFGVTWWEIMTHALPPFAGIPATEIHRLVSGGTVKPLALIFPIIFPILFP